MSLLLLAPLAVRSGYGSLARGMARALYELMPDMAAVDLVDFPGGRLKTPPLPPETLARAPSPGCPWLRVDVPWRRSYPRAEAALASLYTMFEASPLDASWVHAIGVHDSIIVPSRFCEEMFSTAGCRNVVVCQPGIDLRFTPQATPLRLATRSIVFLFVGEFTHRKGIDVALRAYGKAFTAADDVSLLVKTWSSLHAPAAIERMAHELMRGSSDSPPHMMFVHSMLPDELLPSLYTAATAVVIPSRSEAYGLQAAEAQACGVPVIATGTTGLAEVALPAQAYQVRAAGMEPSKPDGLPWDFYQGRLMPEPDEDHLIDVLRHVYQHPEEARDMGHNGCQTMHQRPWRKAAEELLVLLGIPVPDSTAED